METIDIWVFPNTPDCREVARIVGNDRRVRLIDAEQFRDFLPKELSRVPGFTYTAKDGKKYPWEGEQCLNYVKMYFANTNHLVGSMPGVPVQDVRDQYNQYNQPYQPMRQPMQQQPMRQPMQQQPMRQPMQQQPMRQPMQQQQPMQQPSAGFGSNTFSQYVSVRGESVVQLDDGTMGVGGRKVDIQAERAQQDAMYGPRR